MDDQKNCIFVSRKEFTTILVRKLYPGLYQGLKSIWNQAKASVPPRDVYSEYQKRLSRVRKWNQDVIDAEYHRIIEKSQCSYFEELVKRIFILNTQILAAFNMNQDPNKTIRVKIPKGSNFVYACYKECAKSFYENPLLMEDRHNAITRVEQSKNLQRAYKLIMICIEDTIREMLPIENILKNINEPMEEGEDATPPASLFHNMSAFSHMPSSSLATNPREQRIDVSSPVGGSDVVPSGNYPQLSNILGGSSNLEVSSTHSVSNDHCEEKSDEPKVTFDSHVHYEGSVDKPDYQQYQEHDGRNDSTSKFVTKKFDVDSLFEPERSPEQIGSPEKPEKSRSFFDLFSSNKARDPNTKTIFLKPRHNSSIEKPSNRDEKDINSENEIAEDAREKRDIGGEIEQIDDLPIVRTNRPSDLVDLDVYSTNNELQIKNIDPENPEGRDDKIERNDDDSATPKLYVPPIHDVDKENFFSDSD